MSTGFILALFVLPAAIVAAALWLAARTRPRDLGVRTEIGGSAGGGEGRPGPTGHREEG